MTRLFLDTEWADTLGSELVSLAMVDEAGQHRFYAEVSPLPKDPTDFVKRVVYPLLEHGDCAMQKTDITRELRRFLAQFDAPFVLFDYGVDGALFLYALNGFDLPASLEASWGRLPKVSQTHMLRDDVKPLIERYFRDHYPELNRRRHHAMVDAEALRWAFLEAVKTGVP